MTNSTIPGPPAPDAALLIRGATVLPVDGPPLPRGDILIRDDKIVAVDTDLTDAAGPAANVIDAQGTIAVPGFVDSHVHAWEGLLRGQAPATDFAGYLGLTAFGRGPHHRPQDNYTGTLITALRALDAGITTVVDNAHNALTPAHAEAGVEAWRDSGARVVYAVGSPFGADLGHVPATAVKLRDLNSSPLVTVRLFGVNPDEDLWRFAADEQLWVSTELGPHTPDLTARLEALTDQGLFGPHHALNHCYGLDERAWQLIGASGAAINLAPRSDATYGLGDAVPPVGPALAHAHAIGLSNDNETSYALSMFAEMQELSHRHRAELFRRAVTDGDPIDDALTPARLLEFATLGGAHNAGLAAMTGSLTPGKQADVVLLGADGAATMSDADPTATVTMLADTALVDTVIVAGVVRKRAGQLVGVDLDAVRRRVADSRAHLAQAVG